MEDESNASAPNETHPLLPLQPEASNSQESGIGSAEAETSVITVVASSNNANPTSDDDVTDDCCRRSTPPCADDEGVVSSEPKSGSGVQSEYKAIIDMLKDAEKSAEDPEYEQKMHARRFGAIKYNPRNEESSFGAVDYFCAFFHCCALCIEG